MRKTISILLALYFATSCNGCKQIAVPARPSSSALAERAIQFNPSSGKAAIYVVRRGQFVAAGVAIEVHLDKVRFGSVPPLAYLYGEVDPSEHCFDLSLRVSGAKPLHHAFQVEAGRCYFFDAAVRIGGFRIEQIPEPDGKKLVQKYALSGDNKFERLLRDEASQ